MSFGWPDLDWLAELLARVSDTEIVPRFGRLGAGDVWTKSGPLDFATTADAAAERAIGAAIKDAFPDALVVGEEGWEGQPTERGRTLKGAALAFLVDPIDGTFNYQAGVPLFACMAAVVRRGEVVGAVIHDPLGRSSVAALAGEGAWRTGPDGARTRLRVAVPAPLSHLTGIASWQYLPVPFRQGVMAGLARTATVWNYRCAGHEYRLAASGQCHFLLYNRLLPWDHAPGWLVHREAGGYAARLDGSPYSVTEEGGGLLCAPDRQTWQLLWDAIGGT